MIESVQATAILASATIVSSASLYTANKAREIASKTEQNEDRSKRNRELLVGEPEAVDPVYSQLGELKQKVREVKNAE